MNVIRNEREFEGAAAAQSRIPDRLVVFEMANNHMGDTDHGVRVIEEFAKVAKDFEGFNFAFKMQYRQLDTFIHPDFQDRMDIKYIKRFSETRLSRENTKRIVDAIKSNGFLAMCTPFDDESVELVVDDGFDILKIASCSFTDWPLLERAGQTSLPIIASTAAAQLHDIDQIVAFMQNRHKDFALMHCVAAYPTPDADLELNQIDFLKDRYPGVRIGYSTHENPGETMAVAMAIAKGADILEKHVAVPTDEYAINAYSATPDQVRAWLESAQRAYTLAGQTEDRIEPTKDELSALTALQRGAFVSRDVKAGERLKDEDVFMAIPTQDGHVTANNWSKYTHYYAAQDLKKGEPVLQSNTRAENVREKIYGIVQDVKSLLDTARIVVPGEAALEISHHYGLEKFDDYGITMITVVNREYCKKLIVVLPGQNHPEQYHNKKEETFHVLHGELRLVLDGKERICRPGDVITVMPGVRHAFDSENGSVIEEISSTHFVDDSFYTDPKIAENKDRKTFLSYWL